MKIIDLIKEAVTLHKNMKNSPILYITKGDGQKRIYKLYLCKYRRFMNKYVSIYTPYNSVYCGDVVYLKLVEKGDLYKVYYLHDEKYKEMEKKFRKSNTIGHCKVRGRGIICRIVYRISDYLNFNI